VGEGTGVGVAVGVGVAEGITGVAVAREGKDRLHATNPKQKIIEQARRPILRFSRELKQISPRGKQSKTHLFYLRMGWVRVRQVQRLLHLRFAMTRGDLRGS